MESYTDLINSAKTVVVEFYATWCVHCQRMMPVVSQIRELLGDTVPIYQLDIDENNEIASSEDIDSTPTFIVYNGGEAVWRYSGELDGNVLLQKIQQYMN